MPKRHPVATPETPAYLDAFLTDDDFQGGLLPRLGGQYLRTISVRAWSSISAHPNHAEAMSYAAPVTNRDALDRWAAKLEELFELAPANDDLRRPPICLFNR